MRILIFDTETTGLLPKQKKPTYENLADFPYIVQLSYVYYDTIEQSIVSMKDYIIKMQHGIKIPEESIKFHGITNETSYSNGEPIEVVLDDFMKLFHDSDRVIAHNMEFDKTMILLELKRQKLLNKSFFNQNMMTRNTVNFIRNTLQTVDDHIEIMKKSTKYICTMQETVDFCSIMAKSRAKGKPDYAKFPTLAELHNKLFGFVPSNLHNSLNDVLVCLRCYVKLSCNVDLIEINEEFRTLFDMVTPVDLLEKNYAFGRIK
jgi:DNA polymerase III epsilon subunit-like protein